MSKQEQRPQDRPRWWQFPWREIWAGALGGFILLWQTTIEAHPTPLLVGAGLALVGVTGTGAIQRAVKRALGD
jgi:hypothetical protein